MDEPLRVDLLRPDPAGTIQSLTALGYTPEAAVADIVDNSISARASNISIRLHWAGADDSWVVITDDGVGMSLETLLRGLTIGGRGLDERENDDLGRFGMGLKTASFSQARQLVVASRPASGAWNVRTWDVDHVLAAGDWELLRTVPPEAVPALSVAMGEVAGSGTVVLWRRLTRLVAGDARPGNEAAMREFYRHTNVIEWHLRMVFSRYLSGRGKLGMTLNGKSLRPWDPFLRDRPFVETLPADRPLPGVQIQGFVLPYRSRLTEEDYKDGAGPRGWVEQQGFYIYRRNRLIVAGDWLNIDDFQKDERHTLARIAVELPPDQDFNWSLDVKKSAALPPPELGSHLRRIGMATRRRATAVVNHRGHVVRDGQTSSFDFTWHTLKQHGVTRFVVNRDHPLVRDVIARAPGAKRDINDLLSMIESSMPVGLIRDSTDVAGRAGAQVDGAMPADVLTLARRMLDVLLSQGEAPAAAIHRVLHMPPFSDYNELPAILMDGAPDTTRRPL